MVDSQSIVDRYVGQQSVNTWLIVNCCRQSGDSVLILGTSYWLSVGQYFIDASGSSISHVSVVYRSTVGDLSVNCQWYSDL